MRLRSPRGFPRPLADPVKESVTDPGLHGPHNSLTLWSPGPQLIVVGGTEDPSFIWDPVTRRRTPLPAGWYPLTWSLDGTWILESWGRDLGRLDPAHPDTVTPLGPFPVPVYGAAWISDARDPLPPPPPGPGPRPGGLQ